MNELNSYSINSKDTTCVVLTKSAGGGRPPSRLASQPAGVGAPPPFFIKKKIRIRTPAEGNPMGNPIGLPYRIPV